MIAFTRLAKINRIVGQQCKNFAVGRRRGTNLPARANPKAPATIKSSWTAVTDEASGQIYWWNKATNETVMSSLHSTQKHRSNNKAFINFVQTPLGAPKPGSEVAIPPPSMPAVPPPQEQQSGGMMKGLAGVMAEGKKDMKIDTQILPRQRLHQQEHPILRDNSIQDNFPTIANLTTLSIKLL